MQWHPEAQTTRRCPTGERRVCGRLIQRGGDEPTAAARGIADFYFPLLVDADQLRAGARGSFQQPSGQHSVVPDVDAGGVKVAVQRSFCGARELVQPRQPAKEPGELLIKRSAEQRIEIHVFDGHTRRLAQVERKHEVS